MLLPKLKHSPLSPPVLFSPGTASTALHLTQCSLTWRSVVPPVRMPSTAAMASSQMRLTCLTFSQVFALHWFTSCHSNVPLLTLQHAHCRMKIKMHQTVTYVILNNVILNIRLLEVYWTSPTCLGHLTVGDHVSRFPFCSPEMGVNSLVTLYFDSPSVDTLQIYQQTLSRMSTMCQLLFIKSVLLQQINQHSTMCTMSHYLLIYQLLSVKSQQCDVNIWSRAW